MSQNNGANASDKALARIDATSGEVLTVQDEDINLDSIIPYESLSGLIDTFRQQMWPDAHMPVHLAALNALDVDDSTKEALLEAYNQKSMLMKDFVGEYANIDVRVLGMMVFEQAPFVPKGSKTGEKVPGFYQPKLLIELPDGKLAVVRTSSQYLAEQIFFAIKTRGWWLFDEAIVCRFNSGENGKLFMQQVYSGGESLKSRLSKKVTAK